MNKNNLERHAEYYEAILQLRPAKREVIDFIFDLIENRNDVKVSKVKEVKTGMDLYLSNQRFARGTLATQIKRKFRNCKVVISKSLYGQHKMTSRLTYRATILIRFE